MQIDTGRNVGLNFGAEKLQSLQTKIMDKIQTKIESGEVDVDQLSSRLNDRFGEGSADKVINESGDIDINALESLIQEKRQSVSFNPGQFGVSQGQGMNQLFEMLSTYQSEEDDSSLIDITV